MLKKLLCLTAVLALLTAAFACAFAEEEDESFGDVPVSQAREEAEELQAAENAARQLLIDRIIETGHQLYIAANGKLQRAHYAGDIYVCKNFTVHVFRENSADFRLAAFPDVKLSVPDNLPSDACKPYSYGYCWEDVKPEDGNPFYIAAQFLYDKSLSKQENMERALAFMRQVQRGDYFQMSAEYYYGVGAHSAIMISDYDPDANTVHWMDSNMAGEKRNGIRYGKVQWDAVKDISWWADAFCKRGRGATLYRLRDDIVYVGD
ncbi:MAG: hypothetical protein IJ240_08385 [Clostridia bacterium]|nr:hypothetical protein [Clostridia bacterium]